MPDEYDLYVTQEPVTNAEAMPRRRVAELRRWVEEGEFDRILGGHYVRRGAEDPHSDAGAAYDHYVNRFWQIFQDASEGAQTARVKLEDWMRRG